MLWLMAWGGSNINIFLRQVQFIFGYTLQVAMWCLGGLVKKFILTNNQL